MNNRRVVVFDLGNVLITWDRGLLFSKLIADADELQWFLDNVFTLESNQQLDRGMPLAEVVEMVATRHPDHRETIVALRDRWTETLGDVIDGTVEILRELRAAQVPLYALSNWGADTFAMIEDRYAFFDCFHGMVISGREGITKPDPALFMLMCNRYGFSPDQAVLIDDSSANVAAALSLGFDALLYDNSEQLRHQLIERQLL